MSTTSVLLSRPHPPTTILDNNPATDTQPASHTMPSQPCLPSNDMISAQAQCQQCCPVPKAQKLCPSIKTNPQHNECATYPQYCLLQPAPCKAPTRTARSALTTHASMRPTTSCYMAPWQHLSAHPPMSPLVLLQNYTTPPAQPPSTPDNSCRFFYYFAMSVVLKQCKASSMLSAALKLHPKAP
jgi:hypothetical protein